ncbi:MAG: DUF4968 domain-containing protein, partial [Treponema sp.]|nr:DUF4968 domain-containing protein [Treponema sp.]
MTILPEHWHIAHDPCCYKDSVIQGDSWRISVLTPCLLRLEYSPDGIFEDRASQFALNRNFPACVFDVEDRPDELVIS